MYNTVPAEVQFFLACVFSGFIVSFLYDLFRISRRIVKVNDIVVNVEDVIFFVLAAGILFYAAYVKNSGKIRWQWFIGGACGIGIYILIVRNRFLNVSTLIIAFIVKVFETVLRIVIFPVRIIFRVFRKPISVMAWYTGRGIGKVKSAVKYGKLKMRISTKNIYTMLRKR